MIKVYPNESSIEIADYILWLQEQVDKLKAELAKHEGKA